MAQITLDLNLPRDARFVPVLRHVSESLLDGLLVPRESIDDVALALSEACGNVIRHADDTTEYGVRLSVDDDGCEIEVRDLGPGFEPEALTEVLDEPESGRGIPLIEALMDDLEFTRTDTTTTVRLVKRWDAMGLRLRPEDADAPA